MNLGSSLALLSFVLALVSYFLLAWGIATGIRGRFRRALIISALSFGITLIDTYGLFAVAHFLHYRFGLLAHFPPERLGWAIRRILTGSLYGSLNLYSSPIVVVLAATGLWWNSRASTIHDCKDA